MASIHTEILIDSRPDDVWAALRDWGAIHERLARGFITDCRLDGHDRLVTFIDGTVLRERLVDLDDKARRIVWSIVDGPYTHHNGAAQVFAEGDDRSRFVWITDLLPNHRATRTQRLMQQGASLIKETLESAGERVAFSSSAERPSRVESRRENIDPDEPAPRCQQHRTGSAP